MMRLLAAVGAFTAFVATTVAWAVDTPIPPSPSTVDLFISQLGSESFADREAAARALEATGPAAVPALEAATRSASPEVSRRATEILARLRRSTDSTTRIAPKAVRLSYKNAPLGTAVNDLKARTGLPIVLDLTQVADPTRSVTCEAADLPVWEALATFCQAAGLREVFAAELEIPRQEQRPRRGYYTPPPPPPAADMVPITLADGKYNRLPGSRLTAIRVLALPASFPGHRVTLGTGEVTLNFDVAPVPGLHWQDVAGVRVMRLIDDAGRFGTGGSIQESEAAPNPLTTPMFVGGRGGVVAMRWDFEGNPMSPLAHANPRLVPVPLKLATPSARSLKLLEGAVVCEVLVPDQPLAAIPAPAQHVGTTFEGANGLKVTVLNLRDAGSGTGKTMQVRLESPSPWITQRRRTPFGPLWPEQGRPAGMGNQVRAFDASGKPLLPLSSGLTELNDDGMVMRSVIQLTYRSGVPARIEVVGPKQVIVDVPFKMENVPLP